ncbi:MAG TPA: serine/threonine-protein kinase [Polyangia bacterium]|nr:serine/threonine-protein kinase [Polyangia bacterium]
MPPGQQAGLIGERINNYEVVSVLGEGGMGAVYLALHPFMGRKAAIKVLKRELAEDPGLVERFMNEARAANAIHHPNIIDIIDVGRMPSGIPYLMMEFLEGESLAQRIARERPLDVAVAVSFAKQTAAALGAAHSKGIVHRDLKPDNLFLVPDEAQQFGCRVTVLDFGIAKLRGELSGSGAKTQSGSVMGTPPYMSPEQCRGITEEIDHRTDIYALGIILYEMLTGAPPFLSEGWGEVVLMHVTKPPAPPRKLNPNISIELEAVVLKALAKASADRWQSMAELATALRNAVTIEGTRFTTGPPAAGGPMSSTTLRSASGEVSGETPIDGTLGAAGETAAPHGRRAGVWVAGALALAGVLAVVAFEGRRGATSTVAPSTSATPSPASMAPPPVAAPAPPLAAPSPPVAAPIAAPVPPPAVEPPAALAVPATGSASSVRRAKSRAHRHEATPVATTEAPPSVAAHAPSPATPPPPPAAKAKAEKW